MDIETNIAGYTVTITDAGECICCDIEKGRFYGSLASVENEGVLYDAAMEFTQPISDSAIQRITAFALKHGY
jgi:hypothetical protein